MGEGNYSTYILLGGLVLLMFWMTSRTKKRQRAAEEFRDNLGVGQEVMTGSGLFGTIVAVGDERVTLRSGNGADASTSEWLRQAIAKVGNSGGTAEPQLHFEVRRAGKTVDPTTVLPPQ